MKYTCALIGCFLLLLGCEPLAPQVTQQVIIVTNTPTAAPLATTTSVVSGQVRSTPLPTFTPAITATPTPPAIPTATVPPCTETAGAFFEDSFSSAITGGDVPYNIYLPPCFFRTGRRYPTLYLLHGSGYDFRQWAELGIQELMDGKLAEKTAAPMVIIMPEGGAYQENNIFDAGVSYEDILLTELVPVIERNFCVWQERRAIGGISRGGFWAFLIAFRHPDQFIAVGGHSPWFVPDNAPSTHNPLALAERAANIEGLRIYLDNAQNDSGGANVIVFSNTLRGRGILHTYVINPIGGHNNEYWGGNLAAYLSFYSQALPLEAAELPSCQG